MHATTHNAAREAAQAEPCLAQYVLQCQDITESLRTVLRACHAAASLAAGASNPGATVGMEALGELLHLHGEAMELRLCALQALADTIRSALASREAGDRGRSLALDAEDQLAAMRQVQLAWQAVACMVPYAADTLTGENLAAALRLMADAMHGRTAAMDDMLDTLHAVLVQEGTAA